MLNLSPSALRAPPDASASMPPSGGQPSAPRQDPAGFASLLRQTQSGPPRPVQAPQPQAASPAPQPHPASTEAAGRTADAAPPVSAHRAPAAPKDPARDAAGASAAQIDTEPGAESTDADDTTTSEAAPELKDDAPAPPWPFDGAPLDPQITRWIADLKRTQGGGAAVPDAASRPAANDAGDRAPRSGALRGTEPKIDPASSDPAAPGKPQASTTARDHGFGAMLAEQRGGKTPQGPQAQQDGSLTGTKDVASLASAFAPPTAGRGVGAPTPVALATPVSAPQFAQALGLQLSVLMRGGVQQAELHLNPAEMGPVSVQIAMEGSHARVNFGADVAATRQAIEAGLPELASALRDAGFTLAGGGVSQHSGRRSDAEDTDSAGGGQPRRAPNATEGDLVDRTSAAVRRIVSAGGIDLFA